MLCLTTKICSEKCAFRQFHHCANIVEYTYTNLADIEQSLHVALQCNQEMW
jgi:hypothetical protein